MEEKDYKKVEKIIAINMKRLDKLERGIKNMIEESEIEESIAYLCGIKDSSEKIIPYSWRNIYNKTLEDSMIYESIKLSNMSNIKCNTPLKELKRVSQYM